MGRIKDLLPNLQWDYDEQEERHMQDLELEYEWYSYLIEKAKKNNIEILYNLPYKDLILYLENKLKNII